MIIIIIILKHRSAQISRCWTANFTLMNLSRMGWFSTSVLSWTANWLIWELFHFINFSPLISLRWNWCIAGCKPCQLFLFRQSMTPDSILRHWCQLRRIKKWSRLIIQVNCRIPIYWAASKRSASCCYGRHKHLDPRPSWWNVHVRSQRKEVWLMDTGRDRRRKKKATGWKGPRRLCGGSWIGV